MISLPIQESLCLVLSVTPYQEDSAVITLVGENGLFSALARGIYKPKSPLKPLLIVSNLVRVDYRETSGGTRLISSCKLVEDNSVLAFDYPKSCFLMFLQELSLTLFRFGDAYPSDDIYQLLSALKSHDEILSYSILLLGIFYRSLGINEVTDHCLVCGKTRNIVTYNLQKGGFLCKECKGEESIASDTKLYILKFAFMPIQEDLLKKRVPKEEGKEILSELLNHLLSYFDLKPIRSFSMLLQAIG